MRRWPAVALMVLLLGGVMVAVGFLATRSAEELIIGAIEPGVYHVPRSAVALYLKHLASFDPNKPGERGLSLLRFTLNGYHDGGDTDTNRRCLDIADFLIKKGADVNAVGQPGTPDAGLSALHNAVLYESPDVVRFLLREGANVNVRAGAGPFAGMTPLAFASHLQTKTPRDPDKLGQVVEILKNAGGVL